MGPGGFPGPFSLEVLICVIIIIIVVRSRGRVGIRIIIVGGKPCVIMLISGVPLRFFVVIPVILRLLIWLGLCVVVFVCELLSSDQGVSYVVGCGVRRA